MVSDFKEIKKYTGLLVCLIGDREFCFNMNDLVQIIDPPENEKNEGNGLTLEYGGFLFRKIHLHKIYKLSLKISETSKFILLEVTGRTICFLVDRVIEMIAPSEKSLESIDFITSSEPYIKGTIIYEGRRILVPKLLNIINLALTS